jgi:tRNA dimethylallyltransferase
MDDALPNTRVVAVVGPTAAGKGELGRELARRLGRDVVVCDSVKVYRGLDIGSGKPSAAVREQLVHHMLDVVTPDRSFSAVDYATQAWPILQREHSVVVGGTGFYLRATLWTQTAPREGAHDARADDPRRVAFEQEQLARERAQPGAIAAALSAIDPHTAAGIHPSNHVRLLRALWLCRLHEGPVSEARALDPPRARARLFMIVLDPGASALAHRIERRVDAMLAQGWLGEVEMLVRAGYHGGHKAMQTLGYRQLLDVLDGKRSLADARDEIVVATRQYARRQRTYFRHQLPAESIHAITTPADCPWSAIEDFLGGTDPTKL